MSLSLPVFSFPPSRPLSREAELLLLHKPQGATAALDLLCIRLQRFSRAARAWGCLSLKTLQKALASVLSRGNDREREWMGGRGGGREGVERGGLRGWERMEGGWLCVLLYYGWKQSAHPELHSSGWDPSSTNFKGYRISKGERERRLGSYQSKMLQFQHTPLF